MNLGLLNEVNNYYIFNLRKNDTTQFFLINIRNF